jgi:hypothetical protein
MTRMRTCPHGSEIRAVTPSALGCEECLKIGARWVHLRLCRICGHVGCCDQSPTGTPPSISTPPATQSSREGWGWCYVDDTFVDLPDTRPQNGPIPRYV